MLLVNTLSFFDFSSLLYFICLITVDSTSVCCYFVYDSKYLFRKSILVRLRTAMDLLRI